MNTHKVKGEGGFIKLIIAIVIALLILSYFGFNLRDLVNAPTTKDNFSYVASSTTTFWDKYLKKPATYIWNDVLLSVLRSKVSIDTGTSTVN